MKKAYEPFKAKCLQTVQTNDTVYFTEGNQYSSCYPEVWPDSTMHLALIDNEGGEHFMDWKWYHKYFTTVTNSMEEL